jgi:hypothetical protein
VVVIALLCAGTACAGEGGGEILYKSDFDKEETGKEARELGFVMVGEGDIRIKADGQHKVLELPPFPLDTCGFLFGPAESENVTAQARFFGTASGRRFPVFAVGVGGVGAYMLRLQPVRKTLDLMKGDEVKKSVPCGWTSGSWTVLALSVRKTADGAWRVQGRAWEFGKDESTEWAIAFDDNEKPKPGKAGVWVTPFSGEPIRIGELVVARAK